MKELDWAKWKVRWSWWAPSLKILCISTVWVILPLLCVPKHLVWRPHSFFHNGMYINYAALSQSSVLIILYWFIHHFSVAHWRPLILSLLFPDSHSVYLTCIMFWDSLNSPHPLGRPWWLGNHERSDTLLPSLRFLRCKGEINGLREILSLSITDNRYQKEVKINKCWAWAFVWIWMIYCKPGMPRECFALVEGVG